MAYRWSPLARLLGCVAPLVSLLASGVSASTEESDGAWRRILTPSARYGQASVYDPVRRRMIALGGHDGVRRLGEIWTLSLAGPPTWSPLVVAGAAPSPRYTHSAIYDPLLDRVIVFGGDDGAPRNDIWALSLSGTPAWSLLTPVGEAPEPRYRHTAVYDPVGNRMIVFGGKDTTLLGDVWALSLSGTPEWSRLETTGMPPSARYRHSAIYDPARDRMIVFGGDDGHRQNDLWALDLSGAPAWSRIVASGVAPSGRRNAVVIHDPIRDRLLVIGGHDGSYKDDVWSLTLAGNPSWSLVAPAGTPPAGWRSHIGIYDPATDGVLLYGGETSDTTRSEETWRLSLAGPRWAQIASSGSLPYGGGYSAVYDTRRHRLVVFGYTNDTWTLSLEGDALVRRPLATLDTPPLPRRSQSMIYDPVRDRLVVYGGVLNSTGGLLSDMHELTLSGTPTWRELPGIAPGICDHDAFYDPFRDRMVVVEPLQTLVCDMNDPNSWTVLSGGPPGHPMLAHCAYDPVRNRVILFGGYILMNGHEVQTNNVFALSLTSLNWSRLTPFGTPPPARRGASMVYDPVRDRMVVFGGGIPGEDFNDAWALSLTPGDVRWAPLSPRGTLPPGRGMHSATYDPLHDRMVMFGGFIEDEWVLDWNNPVRPSCTSLGEVIAQAGADVPVHFLVSNSIGSERTVQWTLESDSPLEGFPLHGSTLVRASSSDSLTIRVQIPQTMQARYRLTLTAWYAGAEGNVSICTQDLIDRSTATWGSLLSAQAETDRVRLRWQVSGAEPVRVYRRGPTTPWADLGQAVPIGDGVFFEDRDVKPGERYGYRILVRHDGRDVLTGETWVEIPHELVLALHGARPNPARENLAVSLSLPAEGPVRLELFDLAGRRIGSRQDLILGPGNHIVRPSPFTRLDPGVYVVRLEYAGRRLQARAIVVR